MLAVKPQPIRTMKNSANLERGDLVVAIVDIPADGGGTIKKGTLGVVFEEADYYGDDGGPMVRWFSGEACDVYDEMVDLPG